MEFSFVPKSKYFFENGNLGSLNSKSFARILDHKLSEFIGIIDWQSQSLNLIPYLGALIGNIIGVLLTMSASQDFIPILKVLGAISAVQFLDNNILMPRIVGGKVQLNALASILGVLCGGAFAGIPGMFLSLPLLAVLKIIFDHSNGLKQWGVLLGNGRK